MAGENHNGAFCNGIENARRKQDKRIEGPFNAGKDQNELQQETLETPKLPRIKNKLSVENEDKSDDDGASTLIAQLIKNADCYVGASLDKQANTFKIGPHLRYTAAARQAPGSECVPTHEKFGARTTSTTEESEGRAEGDFAVEIGEAALIGGTAAKQQNT